MRNRSSAHSTRFLLVLVATVMVVGLLGVGLIYWLPSVLVGPEHDLTKKAAARLKAENDVRSALLQALAGAALLAGLIFTGRTYILNREGQRTERFTHAIDQLGNRDSLDVRLGGIYALERIAQESRRDHGPIMEVLTAFVRERASWTEPEDDAERLAAPAPERFEGDVQDVLTGLRRRIREVLTAFVRKRASRTEPEDDAERLAAAVPKRLEADVQAVLTVLGRRNRYLDPPGVRLYLAGTNLENANLAAAHFEGVDLTAANLNGANFEGAHLRDGRFERAHIERANFDGAHLRGAVLRDAHLHGAELRGADMTDAWLPDADLGSAVISAANLEGATLSGANLEDAVLWGARLTGTDLANAELTRSRLDGVDLSKARTALDLLGEQARELVRKQFAAAFTSDKTRLPGGLKPEGPSWFDTQL
jgi:Pentapeptide repeats (8 copies)